MTKKEISTEETTKIPKKPSKYFLSLRKNTVQYMEEEDISLKEMVARSGLNWNTLNSFLYDYSLQDCKLSTAVGICNASGRTIAEMAETGTIEDRLLQTIKTFRSLTRSEKELICFLIDYFAFTHKEHKSEKEIRVMLPECNNNGNLKRTNDYGILNIESVGEELLHKIFMGVRIPCEHLLPHYLKGQILLVANDREAIGRENTLIILNDNLVITRRVIENGKPRYYGIRDGVFHAEDDDRVYVVGYIAKTINEENAKWVKKEGEK